MDLAQFDTTKGAEQGIEVVLENPVDGKPLVDEETKEPVSITVLGMDSREYQANLHRIASRRMGRKSRNLRLSGPEIEEENISALALATKSWKHIKVDGEKLSCNDQNAAMLYRRFPWVREQVQEAVNDRARVLGNS